MKTHYRLAIELLRAQMRDAIDAFAFARQRDDHAGMDRACCAYAWAACQFRILESIQ